MAHTRPTLLDIDIDKGLVSARSLLLYSSFKLRRGKLTVHREGGGQVRENVGVGHGSVKLPEAQRPGKICHVDTV